MLRIMGIRTHRLTIVILSLLVLTFSGCKKVKDIRVVSAQVEKVTLLGFTGLEVHMAVGIDNPALQIGLEDINGSIKHSGKVLGRMTVAPFTVKAKSAEIYHLKARLTLGEDATLKDLMKFTDPARLEECMIDLNATPRLKSGLGTPIKLQDIPLKKLLESN